MSSEGARDDQSLAGGDAIVVEHAVKTFGKCAAIDDISFSIYSGELFGFHWF